MKAVNSKTVCVFIVVRLYRPNREVKDTTPSGAQNKNFLFMHLWLDMEDFKCTLLIYTSCCVCVRHTIVILEYEQE